MDSDRRDVSLRFDKAQFATGGASGAPSLTCELCQGDVAGSYYEVNGQTACESCRRQVEASRPQGPALGRMFRAVLGGGLGCLVGAGIYYAVLALSGYEVGLVAIVVGLLVGFGVRWGSGGVGGRAYQVLAVGITYLPIVSTYVPFIVQEILKEGEAMESSAAEGVGEAAGGESIPTLAETIEAAPAEPLPEGGEALVMAVVALGLLLLLAMASPFLAGIQNVIGIAIIGFALYEAWRVNAFTPLSIEGPFQVGDAPSSVTT